MASDDVVLPMVIPVSVGELFHPDETRTVAGGGTRLVKIVPIDDQGKTLLPCIWRSHLAKQGLDNQGNPIKVNACLLLVSKDPPTVMAAEVAVDAWPHFSQGPVEW